MLILLEWTGALAGAAGALLLACNKRWSGYGFVLFLFANAAWMAYGALTATFGLVTMQIVCTGTSLLGIWRWLVLPSLSRRSCREDCADNTPPQWLLEAGQRLQPVAGDDHGR